MSLKHFILSHRFLYEIYFFISKKGINRKRIDKRIKKMQDVEKKVCNNLYITLTSYGERIPDLKYTLYSLVSQTVKAEKILVWLSEDNFDDSKIPSDLNIFRKYGVEFKYCKDIRCFTKIIPSLREYKDKIFVTADDDIFYRKKWLEKLWNAHNLYPNDIVAHICHEITFDNDLKLESYNDWSLAVKKSDSKFPFLTGVGGVLYPIGSLYKDILDDNIFMNLTPYADDIWLYFMAILNDTRIRIVPNPYNRLCYVDIYKEYNLNGKTTLQSSNVGECRNDKQIKALMDYYGLSNEILYSKVNEKG